MANRRSIEFILRSIKALERRHFFSGYADLELSTGWAVTPPDAPYAAVEFPPALDLREITSVLVYKPDEIGDAVYALPAIKEMKSTLSHARFFILCQKSAGALYERTGFFEQVLACELKYLFNRFPYLNVGKTLGECILPSFDLAIYLRTYPASFRQFLKIPAKNHLHPLDPRMKSNSIHRVKVSLWGKSRKHQVLQNLEIVSYLTRKTYHFSDVQYPPLRWTSSDREGLKSVFGNEIPEKYLVIHPFARFETRRYPLEYWETLFRSLKSRFELPIVITGGKSDPQLDFPGLIQAQGKLTLSQSGYLISQASGFLGSLSGPTHLAAVLGVPSVVLFSGHSLTSEWAPLGTVLILRVNVPCAPCHHRICPGYKLRCLTDLTPELVWPKTERFLAPFVGKKEENLLDVSMTRETHPRSNEILPETSPG